MSTSSDGELEYLVHVHLRAEFAPETPVNRTGLNSNVATTLQRGGIETLGQLLELGTDGVMKTVRLTPKGKEQVRRLINFHGETNATPRPRESTHGPVDVLLELLGLENRAENRPKLENAEIGPFDVSDFERLSSVLLSRLGGPPDVYRRSSASRPSSRRAEVAAMAGPTLRRWIVRGRRPTDRDLGAVAFRAAEAFGMPRAQALEHYLELLAVAVRDTLTVEELAGGESPLADRPEETQEPGARWRPGHFARAPWFATLHARLILTGEPVLGLAEYVSGSQWPDPEPEAEHCWVGPDASVDVHGYTIDCSYVGTSLAAVPGGWLREEPTLIKPSLAVAQTIEPDPLVSEGSYESMGSGMRSRYLAWTAAGRPVDSGEPPFIDLMLATCERRLLIDLHSSPEREAEATSLIEILAPLAYRHHRAASFVEFTDVALALAGGEPASHSSLNALSLAIGKSVFEVGGIGVSEVLECLYRFDEAFLRTPARRCRAEFITLFRLRFHERYGEQAPVDVSYAPKLTVTYRPVNPSIDLFTFILPTPYPDLVIYSRTWCWNEFRELMRACSDELDAYSRYLGRQPKAAGTPEAERLLPPDLR